MARRAREPVSIYHTTPSRPAGAGSVRKRSGARAHSATTAGSPDASGPNAGPVRAKLFANGRSQAVRLPKEFRMPGTEVLIHRDGDRVILEPVADIPRDAKGWPIGFWKQMAKLREGVDWDEFQIPDDPVPPPITPFDQR
ncbi:MAG: AbrB/MazE/SpoVT family DNA-binding domain-containing protein [Planctomycetes bacterium]|nr:AbrB/MazE/SpoVT family DNA-binding domain-containing protein [Planctomycetota bacterium]